MEQLLLKMDDTSEVKVIAASAYNFRIELVKKVGKDGVISNLSLINFITGEFSKTDSFKQFIGITQEYAMSQHLPFINTLCNNKVHCSLQATQLTAQGELGLIVKHQNKIALIYLPKRNQLIDFKGFSKIMIGGQNVFY